jgi:hypothetical protein
MDVLMLDPWWVGKVGEDDGNGLALRDGGNEILFAARSWKTLSWVPAGSFTMNPETLMTAEDVLGDLPDDTTPPVAEPPPEQRTPFPRRREK